MSKTKIEWCDYTLNPVKGLCPMKCSYCYASKIYRRFKWDPEIRFNAKWWWDLVEIEKKKVPSRIFVGSTMELFGDWIKPEWAEEIFDAVRDYDNHTFIFLTKRPENLIKYSPFPENCWVGVSVPRYWDDSAIGHPEAFQRISKLGEIEATVKFVSFEPLQEAIASNFDFGLDRAFKAYGIKWVIIGQQTPASPKTAPKVEWIREIIEAADKAGIPVFLKNNLAPLIDTSMDWAFNKTGYRQELPEVK